MARALLTLLLVSATAALAQPVRLAAPGLSGVNVDEAVLEFYSEHFAQQLALRGLSVVTSAEIATLVGLERQRQLAGCSEESGECLTEIAGALGVEGVVVGSVARFGNTLQANLKIIRASDARPLSLISRTANTEDALVQALVDAAGVAAEEVLGELRPGERVGYDVARAGLAPLAYRVVRNNLIQFDLGATLINVWAVEYERVFNDFVSGAVRPAYLDVQLAGDKDLYEEPVRGVDLTLGARLYPLRRAPSGLWFGPELRSSYNWSGSRGLHLGAGMAVGLNYVGEVIPFVVSLSAGAAAFITGSSPIGVPYDTRFAAQVGYAF